MKLHSFLPSAEESGNSADLNICSGIAAEAAVCLKNHRTCPKCGRQVSAGAFTAHRDSCRGK